MPEQGVAIEFDRSDRAPDNRLRLSSTPSIPISTALPSFVSAL
jgi:hypothetical protein